MDKNKLKDTQGRPLTQSLFLEIGYSNYAVYTIDQDEDYTYKGKVYPSLKRLFLECEDPTEYEFANKHLLGWSHWQRLCRNKILNKRFEEWREELEVKLRSQGIKQAIANAKNGGFQASKWLSEGGWDKAKPGRPSKEDKERHERIQSRVDDELQQDVAYLFKDDV
ncbi:hypothetical protein [Salinivibrio phage CW02]|uniref:Uncharacterized protein n=1 Tax=Salinivibrio phage CW02 TaxID=1161935 RepID=H9D1H7_9CAUD|nr:hypothetical protein F490_gp18 [Salinivibrio phage CW02]AFE86219.1 hypothetical protein [Salinivibrio phage CW02]